MSASTSTKKLSPKEKIIFEAGREVGKQQEIRTRAKEIGLAVRMEKYLVTKDLITRILGWKEMEKESEMATVKTMVSQEVVRNILRSQLRQKLSQLED